MRKTPLSTTTATTVALSALFTLGLFALAPARTAEAHTLLVAPAPLTNNDNAKTEPCGCVFGDDPACAANYPTTELVAGETFLIKWKETVQHTGSFRLAFSTQDVDQVTGADLDANILYDEPDDNNQAGATLTTTITVPDTLCNSCTLQLRQTMDGAPNPYYFSCASVRVVDKSSAGSTSSSSSGAGAGGGGQGAGGGGQGGGGSVGAGDSAGAGLATPPPRIEMGGCATGRGEAGGAGLVALGLLAFAMSVVTRRRGLFIGSCRR